MIAVNEIPRSLDEIRAMFPNLPLDKIKKSSEFHINEVLKGYDLGSKRKRDFPGENFPAVFTVEDKNGMPLEFRYFKSKTQRKDKTGYVQQIYSPRKAKFGGDIEMAETVDLAVWLWLKPDCRQSPFRDKGKVTWTYEYVDKQEKAESGIKKGDVMLQALQHAKSLTGADLVLYAKGLGITGVDQMEEIEVQAQMSEIAINNPAMYLEKTGKHSTQFDGRIIDAVDRGLFLLKESFGLKKWEWGAGQKKGELICEVTNQSISATDFLINHIKNGGNINAYYTDLINIREKLVADEEAEAFLSKKFKEEKAPEIAKEQEVKEVLSTMELPTNFQETVEYLTVRDGKRPSNVVASAFLKELKGEEVIEE